MWTQAAEDNTMIAAMHATRAPRDVRVVCGALEHHDAAGDAEGVHATRVALLAVGHRLAMGRIR